MPQEFNPVAAAVDVPVLLGEIKAIATQTAMPSLEQPTPANALDENKPEDKENEQSLSHPFPVRPRTGGRQDHSRGNEHNSSVCPTDNDGCVLSPGSYQQWQPQSEPDEPVVASVFKEKLTAFKRTREFRTSSGACTPVEDRSIRPFAELSSAT